MNGEIDWQMEDVGLIPATQGDFVFAPALKFHHIFPKTKGSIRLAISFPGAGHVHEKPSRAMRFTTTEEGPIFDFVPNLFQLVFNRFSMSSQ